LGVFRVGIIGGFGRIFGMAKSVRAALRYSWSKIRRDGWVKKQSKQPKFA